MNFCLIVIEIICVSESDIKIHTKNIVCHASFSPRRDTVALEMIWKLVVRRVIGLCRILNFSPEVEYADGISHPAGEPQHSVIPLEVKVYHNEATYIQRFVMMVVGLNFWGLNLCGTKGVFSNEHQYTLLKYKKRCYEMTEQVPGRGLKMCETSNGKTYQDLEYALLPHLYHSDLRRRSHLKNKLRNKNE